MDDPPTGQYVITCQVGRIPNSEAGTVVFMSSDAVEAMRHYLALYPFAGTSIALWDPDGELMTSRIGVPT